MADSKTMAHDLTQGSVTKQLLIFAYPFVLSNILQIAYNMIDMAVVGQFVGETGLSAVSIGGDVLSVLTFLSSGFASAGQIMIAQFIGAKNRLSVSRTTGTLFTFMLSMAAVLMVICIFCCDGILALMSTPPEAYAQARAYTMLCFCGTLFIFGYNIVSSVLRGMGESKRPFVFIAIAAALNLALDLLFVAVMNMDAFGAALATVIGQSVSFISSLIYLYIKREAFGFDFTPASFRIDKPILRALVKLGIPLALQSIAISISLLFVNSCVNSYGLAVSAVNGVGNKLKSLLRIITDSLGVASTAMVAQNVGAEKLERVGKIVRVALTIMLVSAAVLSAVFLLFPEYMFRLFNDSPEVLELAPLYMQTCVVALFGFAFMHSYMAVVNGIGNSRFSLILGLADSFLARILLAALMGYTFNMGVMGFWLGSSIGVYFTAIPAMIYFYSGRWKKFQILTKQTVSSAEEDIKNEPIE